MNENRQKTRDNFYSDNNREDSFASQDLIKKEQDYRHKWQDKYTKSSAITFRFGQVCGLIYNLALLYLVYVLISDNQSALALKLFAFNAAIIAFALVLTRIERRILSRKPARKARGNVRPNNRPKHQNSNSFNKDARKERR
jgi:hypothetical protein